MTSLLKIGLILVAVTFVLVLVHPAEADDDVKRKRIIIKVPHRVKHIYHQHVKKVHIHKKKPKPKPKKKPHKHVHVVVEEEEIVRPIKSWKSQQHSYKGSEGWGDWKSSPSSFKHSYKHPDDFGGSSHSTHYEEDFAFEDDHETHESRHYGKGPSGYKRGNSSSNSSRGRKGKKKGARPSSSFKHFDDPSSDGSYEVIHHFEPDVDHEFDLPRRKPKTKKPKTSSFSSSSSSSYTPNRGYSRNLNKKPTRRPYLDEKYSEPDDYEELYDRGPVYPEMKEHPSWHDRSRDLSEVSSGSQHRPSIWTIPRVPEVNEYIDDTNDVPDAGVTNYGNTGGFHPSQFNPITTYTASVVENSPPVWASSNAYYNPVDPPTLPRFEPIVPHPIKTQKKNPGYLSQVSSTSDGQTVSYQSHVGHSSDNPSSSYQSVSYGSENLK